MVPDRFILEDDYWSMTSASAPFELRDFQDTLNSAQPSKVI